MVVAPDMLVEEVLVAVILVVRGLAASAEAAFTQFRTASAARLSPVEVLADRAPPCDTTAAPDVRPLLERPHRTLE